MVVVFNYDNYFMVTFLQLRLYIVCAYHFDYTNYMDSGLNYSWVNNYENKRDIHEYHK